MAETWGYYLGMIAEGLRGDQYLHLHGQGAI
jgi:hypothetical protein